MLVHDGLLRAALRSPSAPALMVADEVVPDEVVSFAELAGAAGRIAAGLASSASAAPGERVVLIAENCAEWVELMYAVPMARQVFVPLNYRLSAAELADQVTVCQAAVLVCDEAQFDRLRPELTRAQSLREVVVINSARWQQLRDGPSRALPAPAPADVAWLIFTSGTSGRAKGTLLTHRSLGTAMVANSFGRPIRPDDIYISAYPLCHVSAMNVPLYHMHGRPVVLMPRFRPAAFAAAARQHRATTTTLAPTMLSGLLDHLEATDSAITTLRRVGYGAAPMPAVLLDRARKRLDVHLTESYGMTELSGAVAFDGIPSPLAVVRVVDDELKPLPAGESGEIVVLGDQVAAGYWGEPAMSSATFQDGWLRTGDVGRFDEAGVLHIVGRLKDVIITGGENVMAREVEDALAQHPAVRSAAVIGVPDDHWGEVVCAFVVPEGDQVPTAEDLGAHVAARLGSFKRPRVVHFVADLPVGVSGKVAKDELRRRAAELENLFTERKGLTPMGMLDSRVAVVTGGAQGLGLAIAELFVAHGASVVLGDVNAAEAEAAAKRLGPAIAMRADVTSEDDVRGLVEAARSEFGGIDVMVNNAGITRDASLKKMTLQDFRVVIDVHLQGSWLGTKIAGLVMKEQRRGSIINMSSISGKVGMFGQTNYSAAKAGIVGLTKAAAKELAPAGVRVNAIQPGLIRTAMTEAMPAEIFASKEAEVPLGRAGEPAEVAGAALFLASDLSSYVTGVVLEVAGGRHL